MLNLSFCNYPNDLNKDIGTRISMKENYQKYAIQLDRQVNRIYGLPSIMGDDLKSEEKYRRKRDHLKALLLELKDYNDGKLLDQDLKGINLLPVDYNLNHKQIYNEYGRLIVFLSNIANRSDHSLDEWSELLNGTWYQVHLLHDIFVEREFDTESLIRTVDRMMDGLRNLDSSWENQLTPTGREHVNETVSKLRKLREWLSEDANRYGTSISIDYIYESNDSCREGYMHSTPQDKGPFGRSWEEEFRANMHREWEKIRKEQREWREQRERERNDRYNQGKKREEREDETYSLGNLLSLIIRICLALFLLAIPISILRFLFENSYTVLKISSIVILLILFILSINQVERK